MATKPTQKPVDPKALSAPDFRWFILYTPDVLLEKYKLQRPSYVAVGMVLAQFGDYKTGERVRPTQVALSDITGVSRPTVKKILDALVDMKAIEEVDKQRHGGTPSAIYTFRRSYWVSEVLRVQDRQVSKPKKVSVKLSTTQNEGVQSSAPLSVKLDTTECKAEDHNKNYQNDKNHSVVDTPSPASSLAPSARDERLEEKESKYDLALQALGALRLEDDLTWLVGTNNG